MMSVKAAAVDLRENRCRDRTRLDRHRFSPYHHMTLQINQTTRMFCQFHSELLCTRSLLNKPPDQQPFWNTNRQISNLSEIAGRHGFSNKQFLFDVRTAKKVLRIILNIFEHLAAKMTRSIGATTAEILTVSPQDKASSSRPLCGVRSLVGQNS